MAIHLRRYFSQSLPLLEVCEHVMAIPAVSGVSFVNHHFKVICVLQGMTRLRIDGEEVFHLAAGDVMVIPAACQQHYASVQPDEDSHIHFLLLRFLAPVGETVETDAFARYLSSTFSRVRQLKAISAAALRPLIMQLRRVTEAGTTQPWLAEEIAHQIVFETARLMGIYRVGALPQRWNEAERLHLSLCKNPSGEQHGPPSSFRSWMGVTFFRYQSILKIERAKEIMTYRLQPISMLAQRLGFNSASAFSRTFRIITGASPKEFQQRLQLREDSRVLPASELPWHSDGVHQFSGLNESPAGGEHAWLLLVVSGVGEIASGKLRLPVNAEGGELIGIAAGEPWQMTSRSMEAQNALKVAALPILKLPGSYPVRQKALARIRMPRRRELELLRILLAEKAPALHHQLHAQSLFRSLYLEMLAPVTSAEWTSSHPPGTHASRLPADYAKEYIEKHFSKPIRLGEVAWFAGISEEHLSRSFKQQYGQTVMDYLKMTRLRNAMDYLEATTVTITEIARLNGFSTSALFCREFRKALGVSPMQYRQRHAEKRKG